MTTSISQSYSNAIIEALKIADPRNSVERVKDVVTSQLTTLDRRAKIQNTRYFNHSFAPDLVISWPNEEESRHVYLRLTDDLAYFRNGVEILDTRHSIVFSLLDLAEPSSRINRQDQPELERIDNAGRRQETLVTDARAIQVFVERQQNEAVMGLASHALAHGGKGLVNGTAAEGAVSALSAGFSGARRLDRPSTRKATEAAQNLLDGAQAARLEGLLQAVWIGSGGRMDEYPGRPDVTSMGGSALAFLLDFDEIDDLAFWNRIGRSTNLQDLSAISISNPSRNLQWFMSANLDHLWGRSVGVREKQLTLFENPMDSQSALWRLDRRAVTLHLGEFEVLVGEKAEDVRRAIQPPEEVLTPSGAPASTAASGISIDELRLRSSNITLRSLSLSARDRDIEISSHTDSDITQDEMLDTFNAAALVREAQVALPQSQHLSVDFAASTANTLSPTKVLLPDLLLSTVPLLWPLDEDQDDLLRDILSYPTELENTLDFEPPSEDLDQA